MTQLIRYEAACRALAECKSFDEVTKIVNQSEALKAYARMAKDRALEVDAAEIRIRAERRLGQMLTQQKAEGGLNKGAAGIGPIAVVTNDRNSPPTLAATGISKDLSSRSQKYAAVPDAEFEAELAAKRERDRQEGQRVASRLQKVGEKHLRDNPQPYNPDDGAPSVEELLEAEVVIEQEQLAIRRILDADDKLAEAMAMLKQRDALVEQLKWRINGLVNENGQLVSDVKYWRGQARKAEKDEKFLAFQKQHGHVVAL